MLSQNMIIWLTERVEEAKRILNDARSTESQRVLARMVLAQWDVTK